MTASDVDQNRSQCRKPVTAARALRQPYPFTSRHTADQVRERHGDLPRFWGRRSAGHGGEQEPPARASSGAGQEFDVLVGESVLVDVPADFAPGEGAVVGQLGWAAEEPALFEAGGA